MLTSVILAASIGQTAIDRVPLEGNQLFEGLGAAWEEMMDDFHVTGYSIVAVKDGKVVLLDSVGMADPTSGRQANVDTRYYIASITKTMTATGILQLVDKGKIGLEDPIQKHLPRFTLQDAEFAKTITIGDLLAHRPGIDGGDVVLLDAYSGSVTEDRYYAHMAGSEPSKETTYTNAHYTLLGRVIEAVSGTPWREYLNDNLFAPLGMDRTTGYMSDVHNDPNFAIPLMPTAAGAEPSPYMKTDRTMHAAGGLLTTPKDMTKYLLGLLGGGMYDGERFLKQKTLASAFELHGPIKPNGSIRKLRGFGHAWNVGDYRDTKGFAAHGGGYTGYSAYIAMAPEENAGMAVFVNTGTIGAGFGTLVVVDAMDRLLGYPVDEDLRAEYIARAGQFEGMLKGQKPFGPNPAVSGQLSLEPSEYAGSFQNEMYGQISMSYAGGYLRLDWEDLPQMLKSTGMDAFTAHDHPMSSATKGRFVVEDGEVVAVEVELSKGPVVFGRSK